MESKINKNIFESTFDSFDLDDAFLLDADEDLKKHRLNFKDSNDGKKLNKITVHKSELLCKENKVANKSHQFGDLSFFLEDLNESDFFEYKSKENKKNPSEVTDTKLSTEGKIGSCSVNDTGCASPILRLKSKSNVNRFSSTPVKLNSDSSQIEKEKVEKPEENLKVLQHASLEADLFDDWSAEVNPQKDSITLSQALEIIEEAQLERQSSQSESLNTSIDLLTGNPVGTNLENLFAESFNLPSSLVETEPKKDSLNDPIVLLEEFNTRKRPLSAQKLNFEVKTDEKKSNFEINFNSDDDFDFSTQELLKKPRCVKKITHLKSCSPDELNESIKKKRKCPRIIVSDSEEDSPEKEIDNKWNKKKNKRGTNVKRNAAMEFVESEAEVSIVDEVSSDESEEEGDYDASFVDEELYLTQNYSADMMAKYLQSVRSPNRPGRFKIPAMKPYSPAYVFSQTPDDNNTEYEFDSFCVDEVEEEEMKTELSDLEIAENILEMDRKRRKRILH